MYYSKSLTALFIFISTILFSQNDISLGEDYNPAKEKYLINVIGGDKDGVYSLRQRTKGRGDSLFIEKFSYPDFKQIFSRGIPLAKIGGVFLMKEAYLEEFTIRSKYFDHHIYLFITSYNPEYAALKCLKFNSNGEQIGEPMEIAKTNGKVSGYFQLTFDIDYSPNQEYVLFTTYYNPIVQMDSGNPFKSAKNKAYESRQNINISVDVYKTSDLQKVYSKTIKEYVKNNEDNSLYSHFQIDNSANLSFAIAYQNKEKGKGDEITGIDCGLVRKTDGYIKKYNLPIPDGKKTLKAFKVSSLEGDDVIAFGYLGDETKKNKDKTDLSYFYKHINTTSLDSKFGLLGEVDETLQQKLTYDIPGMTYMKWPGNKRIYIKDIVTLNKNYYVIAEHHYISNYNPVSEKALEIIVTKINEQGKIEWTKILPRYSNSTMSASMYDLFGGFEYIAVKDKLSFIYLDNPANLTDVDPYNFNTLTMGITSRIKDSNILKIDLDENGKISRKYLFSNSTFGWKPSIKPIFINKNELLMFFKFENTERFGIYKFE